MLLIMMKMALVKVDQVFEVVGGVADRAKRFSERCIYDVTAVCVVIVRVAHHYHRAR